MEELEACRKGKPLTLGELRAMDDGEGVWVVFFEHADGAAYPKLDGPMRIEAVDGATWILESGSMGAEFAQEGEDADECFDDQMGEGEMRLFHTVVVPTSMRIFKYELPPPRGNDPKTVVELPAGAKVLKAAAQFAGNDDSIFLWALVDPEAEKEFRAFEVYPTGLAEVKDPDELIHVDTVIMRGGALVFHVFEREALGE